MANIIWLLIDCVMIAWNLSSHSKSTGGWRTAYKFGIAFWVAMGLIDAIKIAFGGM